MRAYLAGPMRSIPEFNFPNFMKAAKALTDLGHEVFNPAQRDVETGFNTTGLDGNEDLSEMGFSLREALHDDLCYIAMTADVVVVLPGWGDSKGVAAELATARALSIPVIDIDTFLDKQPLSVEEARLLSFMAPVEVTYPSTEKFEPVDDLPKTSVLFSRPSIFNEEIEDLPYTAKFDEDYVPPFSPELVAALQHPGPGLYGADVEDSKSYDVWPDTAPKGEQGPASEITAEEYERNLRKVTNLNGEVRTTSSTGGEKGVKLARFDLIPIGALTTLAEHYGAGALKYDDNQWRKGYEWSKSYAALQRHLTAFWNGENIDPETGSPHMAAVAWHAFTLLTFMQEYPQFDDRYFKGADNV